MRSGTNFPIASANESFNASTPDLSLWTMDFSSEPPNACSTASRWASSNTAMIPAEPGGRFSPILSWISLLDAMIDELADHPARHRTNRHRSQQWRREQPNSHTDPTTPARALTAKMIARLVNRNAPVLAHA